MLRPMLVIGVGGAGGKTIRAMKQALKRKLEADGYSDGIPSAWQFLQIDTTLDGIDFPAPMLPQDEFHRVVPNGANFVSITRGLENLGNNSESQQLLAGWGIPAPINVSYPQMRAIGRQVGIANAQEILKAIRVAIGKMNSPSAELELKEVSRHLSSEAGMSSDARAFVIASLAGGFGSGMFLDIAELLKRATTDTWVSEATSFLYTSEVFESLGAQGANFRKNSLGAMNEVIAGNWLGLTERSEKLFEKLGIPTLESGKDSFGCQVNFLIGARNTRGIDISKSSDGAGMDEVFITIGEALAAVISNPAITEFLFHRALVNIAMMRSAIDGSGLSPQIESKPSLPFMGIGFGRLTLGADRIVDYVADALTRRQVEKLLWPELNPELLKDGASRSSLVSERASEIWPTFLRDSGLDERGSQNQVIDALHPNNQDNDVTTFVSKVVSSVVSNKPMTLVNFTCDVWSEWETESTEFLSQIKDRIQLKARVWVQSIQESLMNQIAVELVANGYFVVTDLFDLLIKELSEYVVPELKREHPKLLTIMRSYNQAYFAERVKLAAKGLTSVSSENSDFLNELHTELKRVTNIRIESFILQQASSLFTDMLRYFFEPLQKKMITSRDELETQQKSEIFADGQSNPYKNFPEWGSGIVSTRYKPRTIERILISPEEYEETYKHYTEKDTGSSQPFEDSIDLSLLGHLMHLAPGQSNPQTLVTIDNQWSTNSGAEGLVATSTKLQISFHTDILELSERNRHWLKNRNTQFGQFTNMSIRDFVNIEDDPELRNKREQQFVSALDAMLALSQPLVRLNSNAMNYAFHIDQDRPTIGLMRQTSKIPFAASSNVGKLCVDVLRKYGVNFAEEFETNWFDPSDNAKTMYATSTTDASLPAWAFESLTGPIAEQAATAKLNAELWMQYWEGRRGRPLPEAVPFSTEIRRSIITGWFISQLFGLTEIETLGVGRGVKIWNPYKDNPGWSTFPSPLLNSHYRDQKKTKWVLPSLLTSAGLSFVEFGQTGSMEALHGYQLLKFLGREVTTTIEGRDRWDANDVGDLLPTKNRGRSTVIKDWVESGKKPAENRELLQLLQEKLASTSEKQSAFVSALETLQSQYQGSWQELASKEWHDVAHTWELKDDIDLALADIRHYAINLDQKSTSDPDA